MGLLVKIDNKRDEKFVAELLCKLGFMAKSVDIDEIEDFAFAAVMKKNNRKDILSLSEAKVAYKKASRRK